MQPFEREGWASKVADETLDPGTVLGLDAHGGVDAEAARALAQYFGMSTEFRMNGQMRWDLYHAEAAEAAELKRITPYRSSRSNRSKESA